MVSPILPKDLYKIPGFSASRDFCAISIILSQILSIAIIVLFVPDSSKSYLICTLYASVLPLILSFTLNVWKNTLISEVTVTMQQNNNFVADIKTVYNSPIWQFYHKTSFIYHFMASSLIYLTSLSVMIFALNIDFFSATFLALSIFLVFLSAAPHAKFYNKFMGSRGELKLHAYNYSPWYLSTSPRRRLAHRILFTVTVVLMFFLCSLFKYKASSSNFRAQIVSSYASAVASILITFQLILPYLNIPYLDLDYQTPTRLIPQKLVLCGSSSDPITFTRFSSLQAYINVVVSIGIAVSLIVILIFRCKKAYKRSSFTFISETPCLIIGVNCFAMLLLEFDGVTMKALRTNLQYIIPTFVDVPFDAVILDAYREDYSYDSVQKPPQNGGMAALLENIVVVED